MKNIFILTLLVLPAVVLFTDSGFLVRAQDDDADDEMVDVEGEETGVTDEGTEEEDTSEKPGGSPDADTVILFTRPTAVPGTNLELPAGDLVEFLIGFKNKAASGEFVLETLDASFRYPMDFNFIIQNFSTLAYERPVRPGQEATLAYSFVPAEAFAGRPFGLSVNLRYRDQSGNQFYEGVYNETVNIVELDEGLDGETFFLYVLLGACVVLLLVAGQQFLVSVGRRAGGGGGGGSGSTSKKQIETGTAQHGDVDYEWLPKETLQILNKSPRLRTTSPKTSPRARKAKRSAGDD